MAPPYPLDGAVPADAPPAMRVQAHIDTVAKGQVHGWAHAPDEPRRRIELFVWYDGRFQGRVLATRLRPDLAAAGIGDGRYAFTHTVPRPLIDGRPHQVRVCRADGTDVGGSPFRFTLDAGTACMRPWPEPAEDTEVTIAAVAKDERPYIEEWIAHHHGLGVRRFLIHDNGSTDGTGDVLRQNPRLRGLVEVVPWPQSAYGPTEAPQQTAYADTLRRLGRTGWVAVIDIDEFLVLRYDRSIGQFLARYRDTPAISLVWRMFGSGGHDRYEPGPVTRRFRHCGPWSLVKSISRLALIEKMGIHAPVLVRGQSCDELRRPVFDRNHVVTPTYRTAQINHYFSKSKAEWDIKRARGRVDRALGGAGRPEADFARHDLAETAEDTIDRHWDGTIRSMEMLFPDRLAEWRDAGRCPPRRRSGR